MDSQHSVSALLSVQIEREKEREFKSSFDSSTEIAKNNTSVKMFKPFRI